MYRLIGDRWFWVKGIVYDASTTKIAILEQGSASNLIIYNTINNAFSYYAFQSSFEVKVIALIEEQIILSMGGSLIEGSHKRFCSGILADYDNHPNLTASIVSMASIDSTQLSISFDNSESYQSPSKQTWQWEDENISSTNISIDSDSFSEFQEKVVKNLNNHTINISENQYYEYEPNFSCTIDNSDIFIFSVETNSLNWITFNQSEVKLKLSTPSVESIETYDIKMYTNFTVNSTQLTQTLTINIMPWEITNCTKWMPESNSVCEVWDVGYVKKSNSTICTPAANRYISEDIISIYRYMTVGGAGLSIFLIIIVSIFNISSPQGIWLIINQFQLYLLLFLTNAYLPPDIQEYLKGFKILLFAFKFININNLPIFGRFI